MSLHVHAARADVDLDAVPGGVVVGHVTLGCGRVLLPSAIVFTRTGRTARRLVTSNRARAAACARLSRVTDD